MADEDHPTSHYFQKRLSQLKVWEFCLTFMANGVKSFARLSTAYFVYRISPYLPVQKKTRRSGFSHAALPFLSVNFGKIESRRLSSCIVWQFRRDDYHWVICIDAILK